MQQPARSISWIVWSGLGLTIAAIIVAFFISKGRERETQLGLTQGFNSSARSGKALPVLFEIPDFALTNQDGQVVTRVGLRGQLWLADVIFTRCAGPCPEMTRRMADLQAAIPTKDPVKFVTLTTDPETDTPSVLQTYSRHYGAQPGRWHFLTGTKKQIADLVVRGLKLTALEKEADKQEDPNDLFIHSTLFVLVDKQGRGRAVFESDSPEMKPKVLQALGQLLREK
jgi:protein SCO1/2